MFDRDLHPKIIDFGFCREKGQNLSTYCGTELFMAPEIICGKSYDGQKAYIWAFGVTIHALATNQVPFDYANEALLINDIKNNQLKLDIKAQGLLGWICKNSLQINPEERLTAAQILDYAKSQLEFETLQPCLHHCTIRRANTNTTMPKIRFQINTPVIIRARIGNINYKKRRQIRSLE
ncbi:hypothetical protein TVAG_322080 [Trichomonas vaginalis G3]|uniref:Protein kinase domain-containing protein n=1 Tax=Trichomonas vaginalis (strain ATCC PRA-98 / G3) TaxID=412133 RepID=A2G8L2_TRIV3|nr:hypothetical protein TVAG_322080 [Trichomonas vaginalis G3]|eukprot:XP_001299434.1 hypothetical protein [Trichomonas vaginalis G3]